MVTEELQLPPVIPPPPSHLAGEKRAKYVEIARRIAKAMEADPLRYGYEPEVWKLADRKLAEFRARHPKGVLIHLVLGGHRAGKTEWRAKRTVQAMLAKPGYKVWACQATQEASREAQQSKIYKYLPLEVKAESGRLREGIRLKVNYSPWGGFTQDVFVLPTAGAPSECRFKFYSMNPRSLEGAEIDEGWLDEEAPLEWLDAVLYRLVSRNGTMFLTFTPRWGYTETVRAVLDGAVTIEESDAELLLVKDENGNVLGHEKVPRVQENLAVGIPGQRAKACIVYFHVNDNPFTDYEIVKRTLENASRDKILKVAYGVPSRRAYTKFPMFRSTVHVMSVNAFTEIAKRTEMTRYHLVDPCSGRNWFMIWVACPAPGQWIVYREWPSTGHQWAYIPGHGDLGPWTVPGTGKAMDGDRGPGQDCLGWGLERYKEEILRVENGEEIFERYIDARYANSPTQTREGSTTLIEQMAELGLDFAAMVSEKRILTSGENDGSLDMINGALYYDTAIPLGRFSAELGRVNEPRLKVLETCPNVIYALQNWTGEDGAHGACKDPIDVLRGLFLSELDFVEKTAMAPRVPWLKQFGYDEE